MSKSINETLTRYPFLSNPVANATTGFGYYYEGGAQAGILPVGTHVNSGTDGGAYVVSPNGQYLLVFQRHCNLVFYEVDTPGTVAPGASPACKPLWASATNNLTEANFSMYDRGPSNGNMVVGHDKKLYFRSKTLGTMAGAYVQDNGQCVIYSMAAAWSASISENPSSTTITLGSPFSGAVTGNGWDGSTVQPANVLPIGVKTYNNNDYIASPNGQYALINQENQQVVFVKLTSGTLGSGQSITGDILWSGGIAVKLPVEANSEYMELTAQGSLIMDVPSTGTFTYNNAKTGNMCGLYIQDNGQLVQYSQTEAWVAQNGTQGM